MGSYKHVHLDAYICCLSSEIVAQFLLTSSSRKSLVGTCVEPVVYVHSRHLQLQGDAAIPIIPFSFFTSFKSRLKQNINFNGMVLKQKFKHGWNTVLRNSKANRTVSQGCHGLMHLLTHKHSAMKVGENKPQTVSKQWSFGSCKMQQGLLSCFCFSSHIRPLEW